MITHPPPTRSPAGRPGSDCPDGTTDRIQDRITVSARVKPDDDIHALASALRSAGLCVVPATPGKRPALAGWKDFEKRLPTADELQRWFEVEKPHGIGVICGKVSGGLEVFDLDVKNDRSDNLNARAEAAIREFAPGLWERLVIEQTPSGGLHLYFRSDCPEGNLKLAYCPDGTGKLNVIAETRGEGGFIVAAPTPGYALIQGNPAEPPLLSADEREMLFTAARSLDQSPAVLPVMPRIALQKATGGLTPFDDFNARGDALGVLAAQGWHFGPVRPDGSRPLRRPGKIDRGWSATWNHKGRGTLTVFSPNAPPFETAPTSYSPAAIFTHLECGGDFHLAAAELRRRGFGGLASTREQQSEKTPDLRARLMARRFDHASPPPKPVPRFSINGKVVCSAGNLTTIAAQSKTGKSAVTAAAIAAAICAEYSTTGCDTLGITATPPRHMRLLHFDTEQSNYDADGLVRRALKRAGVSAPPDFLISFRLAGFSAADLRRSLKMQMEELSAVDGIFAVIIDGVADMVTDVNDATECNAFVAELHALAIEHDCPILSVLHENPAQDSGKMRGHLGSQLERKAESNLRLKRSEDITVIFGDKMRGAPIPEKDGPRFRWSPLDDMHMSTATAGQTSDDKKRVRSAALAEDVFQQLAKPAVRRCDLIAGIMSARKITASTAEDRFDDMNKVGVIIKDQKAGLWCLNPI